jgi:hypothetical protein
MVLQTNYCAICSVPISNAQVHRRWHEAEDRRFSQLVAALNATVTGVNRLTLKVDRLRRQQQTRAPLSAATSAGAATGG